MTDEEAIAYFKKCNETLVSVSKDENVYDYEKQEIEAVCMLETFEANKKAIQALEQQICGDMGEVSDGYHTFNQLYYQRAVLFACIVKQNKNKAWKSFKHSDGKYCFDSNGEWFIVGIDTPQGSYTYHYAKEYWDMFDCQELDCGKEWDGHTEEDVTRLLSLEQQPFINKPCISEGVCREDKMQVLDKIREDIMKLKHDVDIIMYGIAIDDALKIIDKYRTESEE